MRVFGEGNLDFLVLTMPATLPYRSFQLINPSRIIVDVYGINANTNWIGQLKSVKEIRNVWYEQVEDDVFRVVIELKHEQHWGHTIFYDSTGKKLTVSGKATTCIPRYSENENCHRCRAWRGE